MKKFIFSFALAMVFFLPNLLSAEDMVSKTPENRKVVLEEFTGVNCGYCPDGHKRGGAIMKANPGKVFLVNIHTGGYANHPQVNYKTPEGDVIGNKTGVTSFPSGSVNRDKTPWHMSRVEWAGEATRIMGEASPVNVATKASVDFANRKLTVEVEYYYTADSPQDKNFLTVMLTQNNILGPQAGAQFNPENIYGQAYIHNHMLRKVLSDNGALGQEIAVTKKGTFKKLTFETVLPADINKIPIILGNLEVVAFVSETDSKIYSGAGAKVTYAAKYGADLVAKNMTVIAEKYFVSKIKPVIEVTNNSENTITSFEVSAAFEGKVLKKEFKGSIAANEKTTIEWDEITLSKTGETTIVVGGMTKINGGDITDFEFKNDVSAKTFIALKEKAYTTKKYSFEEDVPADMGLDKSENDSFIIIANPQKSVGANNTAKALAFFVENGRATGKKAYVLFGGCELSKVSNPAFVFHYAYSPDPFGGAFPQVKIEVSEDGGTTWVDSKASITIEKTGSVSQPERYYPTNSEYRVISVPLTDFAQKESVIFRLVVIPGANGNALYIDEVEVKSVEPKIVSIDDDFIMFEDKKAGEQVDKQSITVNSTGTEAIKIVGMEITGADKDQFKVVSKTFPLTVKAGDSEDLMLKFEPTKEGKFTAKAIIKTDVKDLEISLKGTGLPSSSVDQAVVEALNFTISQNPVKANANVSYNLIGGTTYNVELKVYDVLGNVVANLHDIQDASGQQNADFNANNLSNGTYVLSLNINGTIVTKQIVVSK